MSIFKRIWNYFFNYKNSEIEESGGGNQFLWNANLTQSISNHQEINVKAHVGDRRTNAKTKPCSYIAKDRYPLLYNRYANAVPGWGETLNKIFPPEECLHPSFRQISGSVDFITTDVGLRYNGKALRLAREDIFGNTSDTKRTEEYLNTLRLSFQNPSIIRNFDLALDISITDNERDALFMNVMKHISLGVYTSRYDVFGFLFDFYNRIVIKKLTNGLVNIFVFDRSSSPDSPSHVFGSWEELIRYFSESEELRGKVPSTVYLGGISVKTGQLDFRKGNQRSQVILYNKYKQQDFDLAFKHTLRLEFRYRFHPADFSQLNCKSISIGSDLVKRFGLVLEKSAQVSSFKELLHSYEYKSFQAFLGCNLTTALSLRKIPSIPPKQRYVKNLALDPEWKGFLNRLGLVTLSSKKGPKRHSDMIPWGDGSANLILEDFLANFWHARIKTQEDLEPGKTS